MIKLIAIFLFIALLAVMGYFVLLIVHAVLCSKKNRDFINNNLTQTKWTKTNSPQESSSEESSQ